MKRTYKIIRSNIVMFFVTLFCRKNKYLLDTNNKFILDTNYKLIKNSKDAIN